MNIAVYISTNDSQRSIKLLGDDICAGVEGAYLVTKIQDLKGADVVLNLVIEDMPKIEATRRYVGYGKQVCLLAGAIVDYPEEIFIGYMAHLNKVTIVLHSKHQYNMMLSRLNVFSPTIQREYRKNVRLCLGGIGKDFKPGLSNSRDIWIVPSNRFGYTGKNTKLHMEIVKSIFAINSKIRHDFYVMKSEVIEELQDKYQIGMYNMMYCPNTRREYIANLRKSGIAICTSLEESFGIMVLELLACGVVVVFVEAKWVRALLPTYRYIASKGELAAMGLAVYKDYERASKYVKTEVAPYVMSTYSNERFTNELDVVLREFDTYYL